MPRQIALATKHPERRPDMPEDRTLNLRAILAANNIAQSEWCNAIVQEGGQGAGKGLSPPAGTLILKHNKWPRLTSAKTIIEQTAEFLTDRGIPEKNIAIAFEYEGVQAASVEEQDESQHAHSLITDLPENQMLSQSAKKHFKIFQDPFTDDVQKPDDVFLSDEQLYIRESMHHVAKHGGFLAIVGESGAGKTTLRRDLIDRIQRDGDQITVIQPQIIDKKRLTAGSLCEAIINDISRETPRQSLEAKGRQLAKLLTGGSRAGNSHVLIIEEAHDLTIPVLKYLKRFWELEDGFKKLLAIILIGQPELKDSLDIRINWDAREVINRCEIAELLPLNGDMEDYLKLKFKRVGKDLKDVFEKDAFDALRARLTINKRGSSQAVKMHYPLIVNNAVVKAMNLAAEIGAPKVNAEIMQGV